MCLGIDFFGLAAVTLRPSFLSSASDFGPIAVFVRLMIIVNITDRRWTRSGGSKIGTCCSVLIQFGSVVHVCAKARHLICVNAC